MRCAIDNQASIWTVIENIQDYPLGFNSGTLKKVAGFRDMMSGFMTMAQTAPANELASTIIREARLVSSLVSDKTPESISKQENIAELDSVVHEFVETRLNEGAEHVLLADFLGNVSLATDQDSQDSPTESVTLMTVHAAKGLEFSNVIIVGVEEELFPSSMSSDTLQQIEEERRLLYVAITRAKSNCVITYASSRYKNGQTKTCQPSRFLKDIDSKFLKLAPGVDLPVHSTMVNPIDNYRSSWVGSNQSKSKSTYGNWSRQTSSSRSPVFQRPADDTKDKTTQPASGCGLHSVESLAIGMRIEHSTFGHGTITDISKGVNDSIAVKFDNVGNKKLLLKFARFKIIG